MVNEIGADVPEALKWKSTGCQIQSQDQYTTTGRSFFFGPSRIEQELKESLDPADVALARSTVRSSSSGMPMLAITTTSERIGHWTKMRRSLAPFSGLESSVHARSLVAIITIMSGFRFSVHTAGERLGPDPRRALGPAATPAASTGRTRDRTRPMLQQRQKVLAMAPSTRDPKRASGPHGNGLSRRRERGPWPLLMHSCCTNCGSPSATMSALGAMLVGQFISYFSKADAQ